MHMRYKLIRSFGLPVTISEPFKLCRQEAHESRPQSAPRNEILDHQSREQIDVQRCAIKPERIYDPANQ